MRVRWSHAQRRLSLGELRPITRRRHHEIDHRRTGTARYGSASHRTSTPQHRGNAIDLRAKQQTLEIAQVNPGTGLSDDFINKLASIHMRLELWLSLSSNGDPAQAQKLIARLREQLAEVPTYTDYAKEELIPKVAGLVEGRAPPLETEDVINPKTEERIEELDRICEELRAMKREGVDLDHMLELLHDGYALVRGEDFADEKIAPLQREIEPKHDELEALLQG